MMAEPQKVNIPPPTKIYNSIIFGDLSIANFRKMEETQDNYRFHFLPTPEMKFKHQIQYGEYDKATGNLIAEYPKDMCFLVSHFPIGCLILCDYKGLNVDNNFIRKINITLRETIKEQNRTIVNLRILLARQSYEHRKIIQHPEEARSRTYDELERAKKIVGTTTEVITPEGDLQQQPSEQR